MVFKKNKKQEYLSLHITPSQMQKAQELAVEYVAKYYKACWDGKYLFKGCKVNLGGGQGYG